MTLLKDDQGTYDSVDTEETEVENTTAISSYAAAYVQDRYNTAKMYRTAHESRWIEAFDQFRGRYSSTERSLLAKLKEKNPFASEAFIKVTKTKTLAAYGAILDVLSYGNSVPFELKPTPVPEGVPETIYLDPAQQETSNPAEELAAAIGTPDTPLKPGTGLSSLLNLFKGKSIGIGKSPDKINAPEFSPSRMAADEMQKHISDQILEADVQREIENMVWEMCLYGTGVVKGPFNKQEMTKKWERNGGAPTFKPEFRRRPALKSPSVWDVYPDPFARNSDEVDYVVERHRLTKSDIQKLKSQPNFNEEYIEMAMRAAPSANYEDWETQLRDQGTAVMDNRYEVLEYWGSCDVSTARAMGIKDIPEEMEDYEQIQVNIWTIGSLAIKAVINPFLPERIPYRFVCFENIKYQIWGVGVPENMQDAQGMINTHTRAAQDNLRLAGSVMLEVNENQLAPGQDNTIYAGKIWRKQGGAPGQSIYPIGFNNTAPNHLQFIGEANRWADQASGIPSVMHGQTGVSGTGRTATTMSMIMNSGSLSIRTVIKNLDRDFIKPMVEAFFDWNMQFNEDAPEIVGDVRIVAGGIAALAQREVQSQRLITFLQITANPALAPHTNIRYLIEELAVSLDLDKDKALNDPELTKVYMELMNAGKENTMGPPQQPGQGGMGSPEQGMGQPGEAAPPGSNGGELGVSPSPEPR